MMKRLTILVCILSLLTGCGAPKSIENYTENYLKYFKNNNFRAMHEMLHDDLKKKMPYNKFKSLHEMVVNKLGTVKDYKRVQGGRFNIGFGGNTYELIYEIDFSKHKGIYKIKVFSKDNKVVIAGWKVESDQPLYPQE